MANCTIIMGASGTGKSTSIKTLNPDETVVINVLGKRLPFKGSQSMYSREKKNLTQQDNHSTIIQMLQMIDQQMPHVHNVVVDDAIYCMRKEYFARAKEAGLTVGIAQGKPLKLLETPESHSTTTWSVTTSVTVRKTNGLDNQQPSFSLVRRRLND